MTSAFNRRDNLPTNNLTIATIGAGAVGGGFRVERTNLILGCGFGQIELVAF